MVSQRKLFVSLEEGFANDTVTVMVNQKEVFHQTGITSRVQIGLAKSFEITIENSPAEVQIIIPEKRLRKKLTIDGPWPVYLGVSLLPEGKLAHRTSQKPFHYL
jgi:hypothetical protein